MFAINTPGFLAFAAALCLLWYRLPRAKRWLAMLGAGIVFYLSIDMPGFFVLLGVTFVVWWAAQRAAPALPRRRAWLGVGLAAVLGPLALFALGTQGVFGLRLWAGKGLVQPLGLSYFCLQLAGYLLDVWRGRFPPERRFARLFCYAGCFLSITQGPFNRYNVLMPQLDDAPDYDGTRLWRGALRCTWGFFKKLAIAERMAVVVDAAFAAPAAFDTSQLVFAAVLYTMQLYADFSGYTDIVLGLGEMLGLALPENFAQPLFAPGINAFWRRWHISLSQWLRDYVYISLGGNRKGLARRDLNIFLTFAVSGLWHGTGSAYLLWGALHGLAQCAENHLPLRWRGGRAKGLPRVLLTCGTFAFVAAAFVLFRAGNLAAAGDYLAAVLHNPGARVFANYWELGLTSRLELLLLLFGAALLLAVDALHARGIHLRDRLAASPLPVRWAVYQGAIFAFLLMGKFLAGGGFLYAKF